MNTENPKNISLKRKYPRVNGLHYKTMFLWQTCHHYHRGGEIEEIGFSSKTQILNSVPPRLIQTKQIDQIQKLYFLSFFVYLSFVQVKYFMQQKKQLPNKVWHTCESHYTPQYIETRLPVSFSSSIGPEVCFSFFHPKVKVKETLP